MPALREAPGAAELQSSLRRFITLDQVTCLVADAAVVGVYLGLHRSVYLLVVAAMVAGAALLMGLGRRQLAAGNLQAAVVWVAVGNWAVTIGATAVATFCIPITVVASMLPSVLAVPYVEPRVLWRISAASMGVSVLAVALGTVQDFSGLTGDLPAWLPNAVLLAFVPFITGLVVMMSAHNSTRLTRVLREALDANDRLRASQARLAAASDGERRRIARDLHDGAQPRLLMLGLGLQQASALVVADPAAASEALERMAEEARAALTSLRDLINGVYPPVLTDRGLAEALAEMAMWVPAKGSVEIGTLPRLAPEIEAAVYWCCTEALQNVAKHAGAGARPRLRVAQVDGALVFDVHDDGLGFDSAGAPAGQGLANMADRIGAVGGHLAVWSTPGQGTRVRGRVPLGSRAPLPAMGAVSPSSQLALAADQQVAEASVARAVMVPSAAAAGDAIASQAALLPARTAR